MQGGKPAAHCKACQKIKASKYKPDPKHARKAYRKLRSTPGGLERSRQYNREAQARYRKEHMKEIRARDLVRSKVRRGHLVRPSVCSCCGEGAKCEAHHYDYDRALLFEWYCKQCHAQTHDTLPSMAALQREALLLMKSPKPYADPDPALLAKVMELGLRESLLGLE